MSKPKQTDLAARLHARGLRKRVARSVARAIEPGRSEDSTGLVRGVVDELRSLAGELEDFASAADDREAKTIGSRKTAARKAARTRGEQAAKRSAAARKGARTRAANQRRTAKR